MELNQEAVAGSRTNCLSKIVKLVPICNKIRPSETHRSHYSKYVELKGNIQLHILHVKPDNYQMSEFFTKKIENECKYSLSEDYWFTRWNKPLRGTCCSCSFRRSQRHSKVSEQISHIQQSVQRSKTVSSISTYDLPPTKIVDVNTFVERLIEETMFQAFQEYYVKINKITALPERLNCNAGVSAKNGIDNLGFTNSRDEIDGVILRKKPKDIIYEDEVPTLEVECQNKVRFKPVNGFKNCSHQQPVHSNKPFILLLHGIGTNANSWWKIINSLVSRGYEIAAPDMLGHGYSSAPRNQKYYTFKKLLEQCLTVFDYLASISTTNKFVIIGHSFGCSLATALTRYRPQQIVQLLLVSGGGPTALAAPATTNEIPVFGFMQILITPLLFCGVKRSLFYSTRGKHFKPCDIDPSIPKYVLKYIDKGQNWPEGDAAFHRRILIPTLLVHGLKDTEVTLVQECEMERTIPRAFLELIPNAGHMAILETPEHLSHMILCFLDWWIR